MLSPENTSSVRRTSTRTRRRTHLHVAFTGVRHRHPAPTSSPPDGDPELLALVADPYVSVADAHERLDALRVAFEERTDRRGVFLSVYVRMTGAVADRIEEEYFDDVDWVRAYLVTFANFYRQAVYDDETGNRAALPAAWRLAFDAARRGDSLVLQDAALGVNAHINYDLALTLERVGVDPNRAAKYADHARITEVIRRIVDETQTSLAARDAGGLETLDESLGRADEWFVVFSIDECRDSAWRTAVATQSRFRSRRRLARWLNDVTSTGAARLLCSSHLSDHVHEAFRALEIADTDGSSVRDSAKDD